MSAYEYKYEEVANAIDSYDREIVEVEQQMKEAIAQKDLELYGELFDEIEQLKSHRDSLICLSEY